MSSFRLNMRKMPQNWCQNPLTPQTEWWSPPSQWPAEGGVTFGRTMSACVYGTIPWKSLLTGTRGRQLLHSTCKTPAGWNPALEDAKEPWLKIRERADFFSPPLSSLRYTYKQAHELGHRVPTFFCKLFWFSLALFILFLFFSWQIFFAKVFYYTCSALFFKMLDCLQTEMLKMKFHFKNTILFFPATMMSL